MDRTCPSCRKEFRAPSYLRAHQSRKTPCAPILETDDLSTEVLNDPYLDQKKCRFCGRVFSSYTAMRRHVRQSCKIAPNEKNGDEGMEKLYEHTISRMRAQQDQIASLEALVQRQSEMMKTLMPAPPAEPARVAGGEVAILAHDSQVAVDNRHTTVNINVFGREEVSHVDPDRIRAILTDSLAVAALPAAAQRAILQTAMLVYSDPDHPENLTCFLPNKKTDDALVHMSRADGTTGWEVQPVLLVLPAMATRSVDTLFDKQPFEDADAFEPLMVELRDKEAQYTKGGGDLRPVLVRNKDLLSRALKELPLAGAN